MAAKTRLLMSVEEAEKNPEKWLEIRRHGIGGSDAGTIMGLNPYRGRLSLWMEKTGQQEPEDLSKNQFVYWGKKLEPMVAEYFTEVTGKKLRRCGTLQSVEHPWLLANVDRLVIGENCGVEIKTAGTSKYGQWKDDEIPDAYYAQCQHYMLTTGLSSWWIVALIGGNDCKIKEVPRNQEFIDELFKAEAGFWSLVENGIMPDVDGLEDTSKALSAMYPQAVPESELVLESTDKMEELFRNYSEYKKACKGLEELITECENKIKVLMGDNTRLKCGEHKASWSNQAGRTTIDSKALQAEEPEIYEKYKKVGKPSRRFSMK